MGLTLPFCLLVPFSIIASATCSPQGCGCRPACPAPVPVVPIMLDNCGPSPNPLPPINAPPVCAPLQNKAPVALPSCAPPVKTVENSCQCIKTVVKPQIVQQLITVPSIQRYIQTTHQPVVEHIQYQGVPMNCPPYVPDAAAPPPAAAALPLAPKPLALPPGLLQLLASAGLPPALPPALPALPAALPPPAMPACLPPALPPVLPAAPPCLPPAPPCLPPAPPCLPPAPPCLPPAPLPCPLSPLLALLSKLM